MPPTPQPPPLPVFPTICGESDDVAETSTPNFKQKVRVAAVAGGEDSEGGTYGSTDEMWKTELGRADPKSSEGWYGKGVKYWEDVPASVDGVLGGFGTVTDVDIKESDEFLTHLQDRKLLTLEPSSRAADCGAGIGRISDGMLCRRFSSVDLVEPLGHFLDKARELLAGRNKGGSYLKLGLEDWVPQEGAYDVIWIQWVVGHLTDDDFVAFFLRCRKGLKPGGVIVLKENTCKDGFIVDKEDSSVTRSAEYLEGLFKAGGLNVVHKDHQKDFPKELFKVMIYAIK